MSPHPIIHLIPNAHLDPVWLWDWREGLNEAWQTCRTVLDLMDEFPDLTFIRGEVAVYEHIERHDPATFARIKRMVRAGRWDVVGGTYIQPDTNLPATEAFARQFLRGQRYCLEKFGRPVTVAWAADSFGHSAGLPNILTAAGIDGIAFTRTGGIVPAKPAFWWESPDRARVLAYRPPYGAYCNERSDLTARLDQALAAAGASDLRHVPCFFGLGNHGGGPTRRHIREAREWAAHHPAVRVQYSGLHRFFAALRRERARLPVHRGELNFCLRGCYASLARFKFPYRRAEALLSRAETVATAVGTSPVPAPVWDTLLFNSFHDILPGSSIERAVDDQLAQVGGILDQAHRTELAALNTLAMRVDTTVPRVTGDHPTAVPFLVVNPHPYEYHGPIELEASVDARPAWKFADRPNDLPLEVRGPDGRRQPFQAVAHEHLMLVNVPWRKRVVVPVTLPPLGWSVYTLGWVDHAPLRRAAPFRGTVQARVGARAITLGKMTRLSVITVEDPYGSWGDMGESKAGCDHQQIRHQWQVTKVRVIEEGPLTGTVWVELRGGQSRLELRLTEYRHRPTVEARVRVLWNERDARLKLVFSGAGRQAEFAVPGGRVTRGPAGEVPGNGWVRSGQVGFTSDGLYCFNLKNRTLQATVCRASRYACDPPVDGPHHPAVDAGELKFRFLVTGALGALPRLTRELEQPVLVQAVPAKAGKLPRTGSLLSLSPGLELLALKPAADGKGIVVRLRNPGRAPVRASIRWLGRNLGLGRVAPGAIATWRVVNGRARRTTIVER